MPISSQRKARLGVEFLEDRSNPVFLTQPGALTGGLPGLSAFNGVPQAFGGLSIAAGDLYPDPAASPFAENEYVVGFGPGPVAQVGIFGRGGNLRGSFTPVPGFTGGINVAVGDVLGDSASEIIVTPASNAPPFVAIYTAQGRLLNAFFVFSPLYTGGLNVAVGNVQGGIGAGGFNGGFTREFADNIEQLIGIRPANQFKQEIIVGTASLSSRVVVATGSGQIVRDFFAFDPIYSGGVTVAAGSVDKRRDPGYVLGSGLPDSSAYDEVIVGASSVAPAIRVFSIWEGGANLEQSFFAFAPVGTGVNVAAVPTDGVYGAEIYANLIGTSVLRAIDGETQEILAEVQVYPPQFSRVLNITGAVFSDFSPPIGVPSTPLGTTVPSGADTFPTDDDFSNLVGFTAPFLGGTSNLFFVQQDLAIVAGDGPFFQQPRLYTFGFLPAPLNGP
jgi:hypothetical protein